VSSVKASPRQSASRGGSAALGRDLRWTFLDRDGTINAGPARGEYVTTPGELELLDGAAEAIRRLNEAGIWVGIITNQRGVALGLEKSGRLITGAAAIMCAVFLAFGLAEVVIIKSIGVGLAIAIAIDATIVRILIVPSVMRILGRANWWAPRPLALLHRRLGAGEARPVPHQAPLPS